MNEKKKARQVDQRILKKGNIGMANMHTLKSTGDKTRMASKLGDTVTLFHLTDAPAQALLSQKSPAYTLSTAVSSGAMSLHHLACIPLPSLSFLLYFSKYASTIFISF